MIRKAIAGLAALALAGCAAVAPQDYARDKPVLDLREYFTGRVDAWGVVQDRSGRILKRMGVEIKGP